MRADSSYTRGTDRIRTQTRDDGSRSHAPPTTPIGFGHVSGSCHSPRRAMDSGMLMPAHAPMVKAYATHADTAVQRAHSHTHRPHAGTLPPSDHHAHIPGHTPPTSHTAALARAAERALSMVTPGNATHAGYTTARRIAHACSASTACSLSTSWRRHTDGHAPPSTACSPGRTARHGTAWGHPSPPSSGHPSHAPCSPQNVHEACSP